MVRGTTNPIVLTISDQSVDLRTYPNIYVTFKQRGVEKLRITEGLTVAKQSVTLQLTQQQALMFAEDTIMEVQLNWTWLEGGTVQRGATLPGKINITKNLEAGELP